MADNKLVEIPKFMIEGYSLKMEGGTQKPEWESAGRILGKIGKASTFWIGDWLALGMSAGFTRGDLYDEAVRITGLDRETLQNAVWLANSVTPENRRADLSPSHHKEVAALDPRQQVKMLDQAAVHHWTKRQLHDHVQGKLPEPITAGTSEIAILAIELWKWVSKARKYSEFGEVIFAADKLASSGNRTDFPKEKE